MQHYAELYEQLKKNASGLRKQQSDVTEVRRGNVPAEVRDMFPDHWPAAVTANLIDTAARDMGELLGELPTVRCREAGSSQSAADRASMRTKIVIGYIESSGLQTKMYAACDKLVTFSAMPMIVEPDFDNKTPTIRIGSATKSLWRKNLRGEVVDFFEHWTQKRTQLQAMFPEANLRTEAERNFGTYGNDDKEITVVRYYGGGKIILFCPELGNEVLVTADNPLGMKTPVRVVELPQWDDESQHGTYDKALWVQLAKARVQLMSMEALDKSIHAPLTLPPDVTTLPYGPDAVIHTSQPDKVRRVELPVSRDAYIESAGLEREVRVAARYPEGRSGNIDASVITGQGVQALLGTIDSQLKTLQTLVAFDFKHIISMALELDERLWPNEKKTVYGEANGKNYEIEYVPKKDIGGRYAVDVTYGLLSGMDPNRATVMMLQLLGAGIVDKTTVRSQMPFKLDVGDIEERLDREAVDAAVRAGLQSMLGNIGALAAQGQDPTELLVKASSIVSEREKGTPFLEAVTKVFKKEAEKAPPTDPFEAAAAQAGGEAPPGGGDMPQPPGGGGGLMQMLASLSSNGKPSMASRVLQQQPTQ